MRTLSFVTWPALATLLLLSGMRVHAQSSSTSGADGARAGAANSSLAQPSIEPGGAAITLETSEPLFYLASALNMCGYDAGLEQSSPVRTEVRADLNAALVDSAAAQSSRDAVCTFLLQHRLADSGQNLAQYTSLALYLTPPPQLTTTVDEQEMLPSAAAVVRVLPLIRSFAQAADLHLIWLKHRPEYEALVNKVHDPMTQMVLNTNIFLRMPVSTYDGRRFVVLLEPMLAPGQPSALLYDTNYFVVVSPAAQPVASVPMDDIRHTYLHYMLEPLVYSKTTAMDRLQPLLAVVRFSPLDFAYKSDLPALLTECMIKAIEARLLETGAQRPAPPASRERSVVDRYDAAMSLYNRQAEAARRALVDRDMRQGWILTRYFYTELGNMEAGSSGLEENIGQMIYGMEVGTEVNHDKQIVWLPSSTNEVVRRAPRTLTTIEQAQDKLSQGDVAAAEELAQKALADPKGDHGGAEYMLGVLTTLQRDPDTALKHFKQALALSRDPRTLAWTHIYMGRLYDMERDRLHAIEQYNDALSVRDGKPDTEAAAEAGLKKPFAAPSRQQQQQQEDDAPVDPTGKAEKDAYRPPVQ